jgi:DNA ligase (NAD+)
MPLSDLLAISSTYLQRIDALDKNDIHTLRDIVVEHNILYYQRESPIISDTEYDILYRALENLEKKYDMQDVSSPTYRLAISASAQFQKVAHIYPMISLENTYSREDIYEWDTRIQRILASST